MNPGGSSANPLLRFVCITLAWLPLAFAVWYVLAPPEEGFNDPEYREASLTAPSITERRGIHEKVLERTTPTALSSSPAGDPAFDVETATKDELVAYAEEHDIDVKKSAKVDEIRDQVRDAV